MKAHSPTLETILMVEKTLLDMSEYPTKKALREALPKQIEYPTFNKILDYLEASGKIRYNGRSIIYTGINSPQLRNLVDRGTIIRRR